MATVSITRSANPEAEYGATLWQFRAGLGLSAMGVMALMVLFIISAVVSSWVSHQDPTDFGRIAAYQAWLFPVAMASVGTVMVGISLILWGIVRRLWVRVASLKESLPALQRNAVA